MTGSCQKPFSLVAKYMPVLSPNAADFVGIISSIYIESIIGANSQKTSAI